jgi:hypothetical protein
VFTPYSKWYGVFLLGSFFVPMFIYTRINNKRSERMKENDFITITNIKEYIEMGMIKIGEVLHLKKEPENAYDMEAILVEDKNEIPIGHVANSVNSVAKGTHSAGYIYQSFKDSILCTVKFIYHDMIIAQLQLPQEDREDMQK